MSFTTDEEGEDDGRMPQLTATIIDAGVDYRDYGDDNEESRLIVLWQPDNDVFGIQTEILSNGSVLNIVPAPRVIRVGGSERGFDIEIVGNVIQSGKLGYKAALWMAKLKALGVKTPQETGNLSELIGTKAVIKQLTYNEAKGRPKKDSEKVFWVPIELMTTAKNEGPDGHIVLPAEDTKPAEAAVVLPTLKEDILGVVEGLSETALVTWFENSQHYDGKTIVPLFMAIQEMRDQGAIQEKDGVFVVGIQEPIAEAPPLVDADDLGPLEGEEGISSSTHGGSGNGK